MMNGYLRQDWVQWNEELKDTFRHADSWVYMHTTSYLKRLCRDQLGCGNISLNAVIFAHDLMRRNMIKTGALAEYSQVEMFLGDLPRDFRAKVVMILEQDPRDPSTFKYDTLRKPVLGKCATADALAIRASQGAQTAPGFSPYSITAGVPLPQLPVVVNLLAIPNEETLAPVQATEEIPIAKAENTIDMKMDNMWKAFNASTFQRSKADEPRFGHYQTAMTYTIEADHAPPHAPVNIPPPNAPTGPAYCRPGPNVQQYPSRELGPCIYCDELGHICTFGTDTRTDQEKGIVHLNDRGRVTLGPRGRTGGEISGYRPGGRFLSMREYARDVARQGQQGGE